MDNDVLQQVIATIRRDIIKNRDFITEIIENIELTEKNIPKDLIYRIMAEKKAQQVIRPKNNAPHIIGTVARPISISEGSQNAKIVSDLLEGNNVYLLGKAGTGKTYTAKALAESVLGQPVYQINCSQWTSPIEIRGGQTIKGYEEGQLIKAWANGGLLILDELPKLDPNTAGLLNEALADAAMQPTYNDGVVDESTIPTITNGRGEKIMKGQDCTPEILGKRYDILSDKEKAKWNSKEDFIKYYQQLRFRFCVIGTGNTDMMTVGNQYSGNQKQDYSLVDRFAGSFYEIKQDEIQEQLLTYTYVYKVSNALRQFLQDNKAPQSISLRTMLNFNRTYEQQMLNFLGNSPFADEIFGSDGNLIPPKTIQDSLMSFIGMLEDNLKTKLFSDQNFKEERDNGWEKDNEDSSVSRPTSPHISSFIKQFKQKYHLDPQSGKQLTDAELTELSK